MSKISSAGSDRFLTRCLAAIRRRQGPIVAGLGIILSLLALGVILNQLREKGLAPLIMLARSSPAFWIVFLASLMVEPFTEYRVLRRLLGTGKEIFPPLLRKQALNNLLFGYAGDTYFAAWLQQHIGNVRKALATVYDLAIVSALVNNLTTAILLFIVWEQVQLLSGGQLGPWVLAIASSLIAVPAILIAWRRMRTPRGSMGMIFAFLSARTIMATALVTLTWHFALPDVPLWSWMMLMSARMVVFRLPVMPNKDLAFAGLVALFMGGDERIAPMIAAVALLSLVAQGVLVMTVPLLAHRRRSDDRAPLAPPAPSGH